MTRHFLTSMTDLNATAQGFYIENKNVGNKATSEDWRSKDAQEPQVLTMLTQSR